MTTDHWFDQLNKALFRRQPRRLVIQAVGALAAGLFAGGNFDAGAAKTKQQHPRRKNAAAKAETGCSKGACRKQWPRSRQDRKTCEATCRRCKRTKTKFCILEGDPTKPAKIADCCPFGEPCCGDRCCPPWPSDEGPISSKCCFGKKCCPMTWECCDGKCCRPGGCCNTDIGRVCLPVDAECCPNDAATGWCGGNEYCCPNVGCVATQQECECASGGECSCPDGRPRCNGRCCNGPSSCFGDGGNQQCCPDNYVRPVWCPGTTPDPNTVCEPDASRVCCDGFGCIVGTEDPATWVCCGDEPRTGSCVRQGRGCPDVRQVPYARLATRRFGDG